MLQHRNFLKTAKKDRTKEPPALFMHNKGAQAARIGARIALGIVFVMNIQCALQFIFRPQTYSASYELSGLAGAGAIYALGIMFLMWNATYPAVIIHPLRFRSLYLVILAQQLIGLAGEIALRLSLSQIHATLAASTQRFIIFDALGFVIMAVAFIALTLTHCHKGSL